MSFTKEQKQYVSYLLELMQSIGDVSALPMFGGHGLFLKQIMFALIADDVLYFKVDAKSSEAFKQRNLEAFRYVKKGKAYSMNYFQAPEEALDNAAEMAFWANQAYAVALRAKTQTKAKTKTKTKTKTRKT